MSGTSLDGIDAVAINLAHQPRIIAAATHPLPDQRRAAMLALCRPGQDEIERLGRADRRLGTELGNAVNQLLADAGIAASAVRAIGSHGQTVRHRPSVTGQDSGQSFTLQIGDPTSIVEQTGITTVADFRRRDMTAGGQGAPLVPAFHRAVFSVASNDCPRAIVNIGRIANITGLGNDGVVIGFDTGPGNTLLDGWIHRILKYALDRDGAWAAMGSVDMR